MFCNILSSSFSIRWNSTELKLSVEVIWSCSCWSLYIMNALICILTSAHASMFGLNHSIHMDFFYNLFMKHSSFGGVERQKYHFKYLNVCFSKMNRSLQFRAMWWVLIFGWTVPLNCPPADPHSSLAANWYITPAQILYIIISDIYKCWSLKCFPGWVTKTFMKPWPQTFFIGSCRTSNVYYINSVWDTSYLLFNLLIYLQRRSFA